MNVSTRLLTAAGWRARAARDVAGWALYRLSDGSLGVRSVHAVSQLLRSPTEGAPVLGMTTARERRWLAWYGRAVYRGDGAIADLGCWFGSSTAALAAGLVRNRREATKARKVDAFDLFEAGPWIEAPLAGTPYAGRFGPGESFLPAFLERTAPWRERIDAHTADLVTAAWDGGAVEMLFVDAMKSWPLVRGILRNFFPEVLPGRGVVAQQDFAHWYTPWIHLVMHRLRPWYEPLWHVPESGTVLFRCRATPPDDALRRDWSFDDFDEREIAAAFAASLRIVGREMRPAVVAARAMLEVHRGDLDRADSELRRARDAGLAFDADLGRVAEAVAAARG